MASVGARLHQHIVVTTQGVRGTTSASDELRSSEADILLFQRLISEW